MLATMPKVKNEKELSGNSPEAQALRKKVIEAFNTETNLRRKLEAFTAFSCLKDKTINYVLELMLKQFDLATVQEMQYALTNISILRKVIDKLAKVYSLGVKRTMPKPETAAKKPAPKPKLRMVKMPHPDGMMSMNPDTGLVEPQMIDALIPAQSEDELADASAQPDEDVGEPEDPATDAVEEMAQLLKLDTVMKKCNRYFRTFKNTLVYVKPMPSDDDPSVFDIKVEAIPPFHYDVIESPTNPEVPLAVVLSDYAPKSESLYVLGDAAVAGRVAGHVRELTTPVPDNKPAVLDDGREARQYIWWTKSYHFTTDSKGVIISQGEDDAGENPISELPFVNFAGEQDGEFWAEGGKDLTMSGISINIQLTNIKHIGISQGHGQLYMTGKGLPTQIKVGPNHVVRLPQEDADDPTPTIGFLNANPQLAELRSNAEMEMALMLSTNNLSSNSFSTTLTGAKDFASGIAMMLDKAESIEDIGEQSKIYIEREPMVWHLIGEWYAKYKAANSLSDKFKAIALPPKLETIQLAFPDPKPMISELDSLAIIMKRRDLKLNTRIELIMRDNPALTQKEAQEKIDKIDAETDAEKAKYGLPAGEGRDGLELYKDPAAPAPGAAAPGAKGVAASGNQSQKGAGLSGPNNVNAKPNGGAKAPGSNQSAD